MRLIRTGLLYGILCSICCYGQQEAPNTCLDRSFIVNVTDRISVRVPNLSASDFIMSVDGQRAELRSVKPYSATPRLIILIDTSGSMRNRHYYMNAALASAVSLLTNLPKTAQVSILTFSNTVEPLSEFGEDGNLVYAKLKDRLLGDSKGGSTSLFDAISKAAEKFGTAQTGDSILMVSDGIRTIGSSNPKETVHQLGEKRIRLFVQLFPFDNRSTLEPTPLDVDAALEDMVFVATNSGGTLMGTPLENLDPKKELVLSRMTAELFAHARTGYLVTIHLEKPLDKWKKWKLEIKGPNGKVERNYHVEFPTELAACDASSR